MKDASPFLNKQPVGAGVRAVQVQLTGDRMKQRKIEPLKKSKTILERKAIHVH